MTRPAPATGPIPVLGAGLIVAMLIAWAGPLGLGRLLAVPVIAALDPALIEGLFNLVVFGALALAAFGLARWTGARFAAGLAPGAGMATGLIAGIGGVGVALALSALAGAVQPGAGAPLRVMALVGGTLVTLFQTASEEIYFRGWLQPALQRGWGRWPGIAAGAAVFAVVHFASAVSNPLALPVLVAAGLWFGILADRSTGLALPIAAHFGWNWGEGLLFGADPNPGIGSFGAIADWDLVGSALWGGGPDGLDTSLSALFALIALVVMSEVLPGLPARTDAARAMRAA